MTGATAGSAAGTSSSASAASRQCGPAHFWYAWSGVGSPPCRGGSRRSAATHGSSGSGGGAASGARRREPESRDREAADRRVRGVEQPGGGRGVGPGGHGAMGAVLRAPSRAPRGIRRRSGSARARFGPMSMRGGGMRSLQRTGGAGRGRLTPPSGDFERVPPERRARTVRRIVGVLPPLPVPGLRGPGRDHRDQHHRPAQPVPAQGADRPGHHRPGLHAPEPVRRADDRRRRSRPASSASGSRTSTT